MNPLTCGHQNYLLHYVICNHLLEKRGGEYLRHFKDISEDMGFDALGFYMLCPECAKHPDSLDTLLAKCCH
ncbi:MAG: hypothetical protein ACRCYY_11125 [Trueperaceae bacterium]